MEVSTIINEVRAAAMEAEKALAAGHPDTAKQLLLAKAGDVDLELGDHNTEPETKSESDESSDDVHTD